MDHIEHFSQFIETEDAMELFGHKARVQKRVAARRASNEELSKLSHVWNSKVQKAVLAVINALISAVKKEFTKREWADIVTVAPGVSVAGIIRDLRDPESVYGSPVVSIDMKDETDEDVYDKMIEVSKIAENIIKTANENLKMTVGDIDLSEVFYFEVDNDADSATVPINVRGVEGSTDYLLGKFTAFDSMMAIVSDEAAALEAEGGDGSVAKAIFRMLGIAALAIGITAAAIYAMPGILMICAVLFGVITITSFVGNRKAASELKEMMLHPSEGELASLEVFDSKYAAQLKQFANQFHDEFVATMTPIYQEAGSEVTISRAAETVDSQNPYAKLVIPVVTVTYSGDKKNRIPKEYTAQRDAINAIIHKYDTIALKKYDNLFTICSIPGKDWKSVTFVAAFTHVDKDGVILPNLR